MATERRVNAAGGMRLERREGVAGPGTLVGYAAIFESRSSPIGGRFIETIARGAFRTTLAAGPDVRALWNHDPSRILGRTKAGTLRLAADERGLRYEIDLPDTQAGRDAALSVERGDVSQSSFAFRTISDSWRTVGKGEERTLLEVDINDGDVSPVTYPAYPSTEVALRDAAASVYEERRAVLARDDCARMRLALLDHDAAPTKNERKHR